MVNIEKKKKQQQPPIETIKKEMNIRTTETRIEKWKVHVTEECF